jgi:hypothetical protein
MPIVTNDSLPTSLRVIPALSRPFPLVFLIQNSVQFDLPRQSTIPKRTLKGAITVTHLLSEQKVTYNKSTEIGPGKRKKEAKKEEKPITTRNG